MTEPLVLGLDIGGTNSRALLATGDGRRVSTGSAPGGNPTSHHVPHAVAAVEVALRAALGQAAPEQVAAAVVGMAGVSRLAEPEVNAQFEAMWHRVGLRCPYRPVGDTLVAFAAATPAAHGTLLLAGTGATAAEIRERQMHRIADGHGWLLGDLGSGFWLGREAIRAVLAHLDGWEATSQLVREVLAELLDDAALEPGRDAVAAVINAVHADPPVALARFAPLVCRAAAEGDPGARDIVVRAAGHLIGSAARVRPDGAADAGPLVLAGGLLTTGTPLETEVRQAASHRWPGAPVVVARDGAAGAAYLAAVSLPFLTVPHDALHRRLLGPSS